MTTKPDAATAHLELATALLERCWNPPRPDEFASFTSDAKSQLMFRSLATAFPDARLSVTWIVADDRRAVVGARMRGTHQGPWRDVPATGRAVDVAVTVMLAFDDGVVVDTAAVTDSLALAEQLGAVAPLGPRACEVFTATGGQR